MMTDKPRVAADYTPEMTETARKTLRYMQNRKSSCLLTTL